MNHLKKAIGALFLMQLFAGGLFAEKVIYIHGFSLVKDNSECQDQLACDYWPEPAAEDYTIVGYDGRRDPFLSIPTSGSVRTLQLLNKYCRADQDQSCRIVADSMGGLTAAGVISQYNGSGTYNILYSTQIVSAEGGSEIANLGDGAIELLTGVFGLSLIPGVDELAVSRDAIDALAEYAFRVNQSTQNIGARRLYTIMERLLEELSFEASEMPGAAVPVNSAYVRERLEEVTQDEDLSRYIL